MSETDDLVRIADAEAVPVNLDTAEITELQPRSWIVIGAWVVVIIAVLTAIFAPWLAPHDPTMQSLVNRLQPPGTPDYLLGTDALGRDVLSRIIYGARLSLGAAFLVAIFTSLVAVSIGLLSGYVGGKLDTFIMRVVDVWLAFPALILAIAMVTALGRGLDKLIIALVLAGWAGMARVVRGETLQLREREYVMSARVLGVGRSGVMFKHLLPNIMPTILVLTALDMGSTILGLASLAFLGVGVGSEVVTWGSMLSDGRNYIATAWWVALFPGLAIFAVVLALNLVGDWLRDRYDPRSPFRRAKLDSATRAAGLAQIAAEREAAAGSSGEKPVEGSAIA